MGFLFWIGNSSFVDDHLVKLPDKIVSRSIKKIWKADNYELKEMMELNIKSCIRNGKIFKVITREKSLGYVYWGRVNSCKSGGCSADHFDNVLTFEYFDYYLLLDTNKQVVWVKIYNYQATQGHEVMSRGWLNQFKGLQPGESLTFGKDIEAITGATVSANAITEDIHRVLSCM